jgi:hypothetical protein
MLFWVSRRGETGCGARAGKGFFVAVRKSFLVCFHVFADFLNPGLLRLEMLRLGWRHAIGDLRSESCARRAEWDLQ